MDGKEGFVPAAYLEHKPSWLSAAEDSGGSGAEDATAAAIGAPPAVKAQPAGDRPDLAKVPGKTNRISI